jgi:hypothetical protein
MAFKLVIYRVIILMTFFNTLGSVECSTGILTIMISDQQVHHEINYNWVSVNKLLTDTHEGTLIKKSLY